MKFYHHYLDKDAVTQSIMFEMSQIKERPNEMQICKLGSTECGWQGLSPSLQVALQTPSGSAVVRLYERQEGIFNVKYAPHELVVSSNGGLSVVGTLQAQHGAHKGGRQQEVRPHHQPHPICAPHRQSRRDCAGIVGQK